MRRTSLSVSSLSPTLGRNTLNARSTAFDLARIFFEQFGIDLLAQVFEIQDVICRASSGSETRGGKGDSPHLCAAPFGPFRQMGTVPFSAP